MTTVYDEAVAHYGPERQINQLHEEMAELTVALSKFSRDTGSVDAIAEEIADVQIMLEQMEVIFDCARLTAVWRIRKINRLRERIENGKSV